MAILVTGGAGYIGSVTVEHLIAEGESVVVLDDLSRGHRSAVADEAHFIEGQIGDRHLVRSIAERFPISAVMHFSALAYVGESVEKPELYFENNFEQTDRLLDELRDAGVDKFVFSSTCATYGEPQYVPIDENHPQQPTNPYGETKLLVERSLRRRAAQYGLRSVALRYFNACGATETRGERHDPETHIIPLLLDAAVGKREFFSVFGNDYPTPDGTAIRDYIHVSDIAAAHIKALRHLQEDGESAFLNLGNGRGSSVLEVVEAARKVTGKAIEIRFEPRRAGDPSRLIADAAMAKEVLGWVPENTSLEEMIGSAWRWHQNAGTVT